MAASPLAAELLQLLGNIKSLIYFSGGEMGPLANLGISNAYSGRVRKYLDQLTTIFTNSGSDGDLIAEMTKPKTGGVMIWFDLMQILTNPLSFLGMELEISYFQTATRCLVSTINAPAGVDENFKTTALKSQFRAFVDSLVSIDNALHISEDQRRKGELLSVQLMGVSRNYGMALAFLPILEEFFDSSASYQRKGQQPKLTPLEREQQMRDQVPEPLKDLHKHLETIDRFLKVYNNFWELTRAVWDLNNKIGQHIIFAQYSGFFQRDKDAMRAAITSE